MINYNLFLKEDKHLRVRYNLLPTTINQFCFSTKTVKRWPVTKATSVYDGDANQELLVCLCYDADSVIYFLLLTKTTRRQQSVTFLEPQFGTCVVSDHEMRMTNIPISTCFYKRSHDLCEREQSCRFLHWIKRPNVAKSKVRLGRQTGDWQSWARRGKLLTVDRNPQAATPHCILCDRQRPRGQRSGL